MSSFISFVLSYLLLYKYVALFIVSYLAALLIPLPSNTSLIAASAFASQGYLSIYIVIIVALIANISADITGFFLARKYGKRVLLKIGFKKILESKYYSRVESFIINHSEISIFVTRFFGGVGPLVNILSGLSKEISFKKFLLYGISGELVYVLSLSLSGYFLGNAWEGSTLNIQGTLSVIGIFVILFFIVRKFLEKR